MNQELSKQVRQTCTEFDQAVEELRKLEAIVKHRIQQEKQNKLP